MAGPFRKPISLGPHGPTVHSEGAEEALRRREALWVLDSEALQASPGDHGPGSRLGFYRLGVGTEKYDWRSNLPVKNMSSITVRTSSSLSFSTAATVGTASEIKTCPFRMASYTAFSISIDMEVYYTDIRKCTRFIVLIPKHGCMKRTSNKIAARVAAKIQKESAEVQLHNAAWAADMLSLSVGNKTGFIKTMAECNQQGQYHLEVWVKKGSKAAYPKKCEGFPVLVREIVSDLDWKA